MAGSRTRRRTGGSKRRTGGVSKTAAKSYRRHRRSSHCHKKSLMRCTSLPGCGVVKRSRRSKGYCRKYKNTKRRGSGGSRRHSARGGSLRKSKRGGGSLGVRSELSPATFAASNGKAASKGGIAGAFNAIVPGQMGQARAPPTASHVPASAQLRAQNIGLSPAGGSALIDPPRARNDYGATFNNPTASILGGGESFF
jgi:hypothetical protein